MNSCADGQSGIASILMTASTTRRALGLLGLIIVASGGCGSKGNKSVTESKACATAMVGIEIAYPGASPAEVEAAILLPVEEVVRAIDGVARVRSTAREGRATILLELSRPAEMDKLLLAARDGVEKISTFPADAERPIIFPLEDGGEVGFLVVYGDHSLGELRTIAAEVRERIVRDPELGRVEMVGAPRLEITIEVDPFRLRSFGMTLSEVASAIRRSSIDSPAGAVTPDGDFLIRTAPVDPTGTDFSRMILARGQGGVPVMLGDLASIRDGFEEPAPRTLFAGRPAILLAVSSSRFGKEQLTAVIDRLAKSVSRHLPESVHLEPFAVLDQCGRQRSNVVSAIIRFPPATSIERLVAAQARLDKLVRTEQKAGPVLSLIGTTIHGRADDHDASEVIQLIATTTDKAGALKLTEQWQAELAQIPGIASAVLSGTGRKEITIYLSHPDHALLEEAGAALVASLRKRGIPYPALPLARPELLLTLTDQGRKLAIPEQAIAEQIRGALSGIEAMRLQRGRDEVRVVVRLHDESRAASSRGGMPTDVERLLIDMPGGGQLPLHTLATIETRPALKSFERIDSARTLAIKFAVDADAARSLASKLAEEELPSLEKQYPGLSSRIEL